jgi:5'-nucleotidase
MRVLATNDDGVESPGLHAIVRALVKEGHEVVVAAPAGDCSGSSASIGRIRADERIDVSAVDVPGAPDIDAFAVSGPPGLAAMAARLGAFGVVPEIVVSGINAGLNTGHSTLHSGTVGAVLTAQNFGASGLAVSVEARKPWCWHTACRYALEALELLLSAPAATVLNVNVPAQEPDDVRGLRWARLDRFGSVRVALAEPMADEGLQMEFRATGAELEPESDTALVEAGWATVTAITGVQEAIDWPPRRAHADQIVGSMGATPAPIPRDRALMPPATLDSTRAREAEAPSDRR